ncbi:hypothetical protein MLD38_031231 [Melastoma candidum]|uniref:Uncharacterized protein n=1 Tax=Melastoma candidum TaxID=119954 RepID=A0ACB9MP26_9MYRT|nr:hypothetical protein MLD38_031231 [Melastoma candidum]
MAAIDPPPLMAAPASRICAVVPKGISACLLVALILFANEITKRLPKSRSAKSQLLPLPPGPKAWPILGCIPEMVRNRPAFRWIHCLMKEMNTEIASIRLGSVHVIPVTCPEIAREILKKQDAVFADRPKSMAAKAFSGGYITAVITPNSEQWKKMRRVLTSEIICPSKHKWLHNRRSMEADNLVKYVFYESTTNGGTVNLRCASRHYCGNVIRRLVFNKRYFGDVVPANGGPTKDEERHVDALFNSLNYLYAFCVSDYLPMLVGLDLDGHEKIVKETVRTINELHEPIINERIQQWHKDDVDGSKKKVPEDLLDVLITLKDGNGKPLLTPAEIKAQSTEIMMAAVDNPSNAVEWVMAEMINKPQLLKLAVEEIDRVVGKERWVQESDIPQLNYIKSCIREAFRLHPIAPFNVPHVALSDTVVTGYRIPKGSHVLLSRLGIGRNPKIWDDPLEFKPERHMGGQAEVVLTEPDLRFISFSTGRRGCIAATLGTTMSVMLLARLIQGFDWSMPPVNPKIDLSESAADLSLAKELVARAVPRLAAHLYPA